MNKEGSLLHSLSFPAGEIICKALNMVSNASSSVIFLDRIFFELGFYDVLFSLSINYHSPKKLVSKVRCQLLQR